MTTQTTELTQRQIEVLREIARGQSDREIGQRLGFRERTAKNYAYKLLCKLHLSRRTQLAIYALQAGLIRLEDINLYENKETINEQ